MAEESSNVEVSDRGLFGFGKKNEAKNEEEGLVTGVENLKVEETPVEKKEEEKKGSLATKLHRSDSSSSSSSSDEEEVEEVGPDGEIKKKKKLKDKFKEKFGGDKKGETAPTPAPTPVAAAHVAPAHHAEPDNTNVAIEKMEEDVKAEPVKEEEKKGFLDKIKDKLPGHGPKKDAAPTPTPVPVSTSTEEVEGGEKKGLLGKIMDKIPGYHKEDKEADNKAAH